MKKQVQRLIVEMERGGAKSLAEACGVSPATVTKWKKGDTTPGPEHWAAIENFFGLTPGHLADLSVSGSRIADELEALRETVERQQRRIEELSRALGLTQRDGP